MRSIVTNRLVLVLVAFAGWLALAPAAARAGVTLYDEEGFRGLDETFTVDVDNLGRTRIGNDRARSVSLARGCRAILYSDAGYRGESVTLTREVSSLDRTPVGLDRVSSLRVDCRRGSWDDSWSDDRYGDDRYRDDRSRDRYDDRDRDRSGWNDPWSDDRYGDRHRDGHGGWDDPWSDGRGSGGWGSEWQGRRGVIVYTDAGYRGRSEIFVQDIDDLRRSRVGNDSISSIRVAPGCQATLHETIRFSGRSMVIERDIPNLSGTRIGNDVASSLTVRCRGQAGVGSDFGWGAPVILYADTDFRGTKLEVDGRIDDMSRSPFGNDRASSIRVAVGCEAILYADAGFRGRSVVLTGDVENLGRTRIGNDSVSSIEVRCRRR
ncbi:MAG: beta/gamma crystallin-related protein [Acidobacteriota bacterium]